MLRPVQFVYFLENSIGDFSNVQSTLVISKSSGLSENDISRTSTYQIYRYKEKNKPNNHISQMKM